MTGESGSYCYMAIEVFCHEPYNYKVPRFASPTFVEADMPVSPSMLLDSVL